MAKDVFPPTMQSWIGQQLLGGAKGRSEVNRHVMEVYALPLRVYFLGMSDRWIGDPDDIVQGFFADRLARPDFFNNWQQSGLPLRRWLMNAFSFYLMELRRARRRDGRAGPMCDDPPTFSGDPNEAVDRAFIISVVRQALERARVACEEQGLSDHFTVFVRHHYQGRSYKLIGEEFGVDHSRAAVMARTAGRKFKATLQDIVAQDGADSADIYREIVELLKASRP